MKKILSITLFLLFTNCIFSQTIIYPDSVGTKVFYENGYTYIAEKLENGRIKIYNSDNKWIGITPVNKKTGIYPGEGSPDVFDNENWKTQDELLHSILEESYTDEEKRIIKETWSRTNCTINLFINTETGKVDDVRFSFYDKSYYKYIPVSKFREIELKIKDRMLFKVTDFGKELNYIYYWDNYHFK